MALPIARLMTSPSPIGRTTGFLLQGTNLYKKEIKATMTIDDIQLASTQSFGNSSNGFT